MTVLLCGIGHDVIDEITGFGTVETNRETYVHPSLRLSKFGAV